MEYITPEEMRELESRASSQGLRTADLMENAGSAIAEVVDRRYGGSAAKSVLVVCGAGNNGGDGFVAARYLSTRGWRVRVILLSDPRNIKTVEARENWARLAPPVEVATAQEVQALIAHEAWMDDSDVILDAIFGTGVKGEIRDPILTAIALINLSSATKIAVDIPSGLDPSTGEVRGTAVKANLTVALHAAKTGLRGREGYTGEVIAVPIGMEERR